MPGSRVISHAVVAPEMPLLWSFYVPILCLQPKQSWTGAARGKGRPARSLLVHQLLTGAAAPCRAAVGLPCHVWGRHRLVRGLACEGQLRARWHVGGVQAQKARNGFTDR